MLCHGRPLFEGACLNMFSLILIRLLVCGSDEPNVFHVDRDIFSIPHGFAVFFINAVICDKLFIEKSKERFLSDFFFYSINKVGHC